jgi:hypothetical protein
MLHLIKPFEMIKDNNIKILFGLPLALNTRSTGGEAIRALAVTSSLPHFSEAPANSPGPSHPKLNDFLERGF